MTSFLIYLKNISLKLLTLYCILLILSIEAIEYSVDMLFGDGDGALSTAGIAVLITLFQLFINMSDIFGFSLKEA